MIKPEKATPLMMITGDLRRTLENIKDIDRVLKGDAPRGLRRSMIEGWIAGKYATARKDHLDYVLQKQAAGE